MKDGALATVAQVKEWLAVKDSNTTDDALLERLVGSASAFVLNYLSLDTFAQSQYDEVYDGYGGSFMVLRQQPALAVLSASFNGTPISEATGNGNTTPFAGGYKLFRQNLTLFGLCFPRGRSTICVSYTAGYRADDELQRIPGTTSYTLTTFKTWVADHGVTLVSTGLPMTKVDSAPATGQYSVDNDGLYTFNVAQAGVSVLLSYSYVPDDVNQAVIELVGERYKYKDRIGFSNKSLGGQETVGFTANNVPTFIKELLNKYQRVVPV